MKHNKLKNIVIILLVGVLVGFGIWSMIPRRSEIKYPFPYTTKLIDANQFTCDAMISTYVYGANNSVGEKGVFGTMSPGTDKIAVEIQDNKLYFLTEASAKADVVAGSAKQDDEEAWTIIRNDNEYVSAMYNGSGTLTGNNINIIMIRKSNGMGVWTKTRDAMLGTDTPDAQTFILTCI